MMEGLMRKGCLIWFMTMMVVMLVTSNAEPHLHNVGYTKGWRQDVNYTDWARHETFYVGDWLYFGFDKHVYSVFEVNNENYEKCSEVGFLTNITKGGRDVFNLTKARPFYFISGGGFCFNGVKLAINVTDYALAPAPSPTTQLPMNTNSGSTQIRLQTLFAILLVWASTSLI